MRGHLHKRGDKWSFVLDLGIDPVTNKRKQKRFSGFKRKIDAERAMNAKINEINEGTFVETKDMTMKEMLENWLEHKRKNVSAGTFSHYRPYINNHLIPNFGHLKIKDMKPSYIQELYDQYIEEETLSNQSIVHMHRILHNAFKKAIEWEWSIKNPAAVIKPPKPDKYEMLVWDEFEVQQFLKFAKEKEDRFYIVYLLALTTGMRKGEILGLRWQDIDFTNSTLSVRQAVKRKRGGGHELGPVKTDKSNRNISLFNHVIVALKDHRRTQMAFKMEHRKTFIDRDLVIASENGTFISPRNLDREWYPLVEQSMVKKIRFHDLRHTHATLFLKQGTHPKIVQERLGHSSITVTLDLYSHVLPNIQRAAAEQFGDIIFGRNESEEYPKNSL